jgi:hypothetical protein
VVVARYRPPSAVPDPGSPLFKSWLLQQLRELADDQALLGNNDAPTVVSQERVDVPAGAQRRVSPGQGGMVAVLEAPSAKNAGREIKLLIENPTGSLTVVASPHTGPDGKVAQTLINGAGQATYALPGVVTFTSNGSDSWRTAAEVPGETAATGNSAALLDATFFLKTASPALPNARVAQSSTEIALDYTTGGIVKWALRTASVALTRLATQAANTILANVTGSAASPTAFGIDQHSFPARVGGNIVSHPFATLAGSGLSYAAGVMNVDGPTEYQVSLSGTLVDYVLPTGMRAGDTLSIVLTGDVIIDSIVPPSGGFWCLVILRDQSGGNWSLTVRDSALGLVGSRGFRTPGEPFAGSPTNYVMQSEEEGMIIGYTEISLSWRIYAGTAAQAITGDVVVAGGNGGPRTAAIGTAVIVNADINGSAAIALSKLASQSGNTVVANASSSSAVPTAVSVGTNTVVGRQGGNLVAQQLVAAQMADSILLPAKLAQLASNIGILFTIRVAFTALATGAADDVTIYSANAPFAFRILNVTFLVSAAIAASTLVLRDTSGGGGAALSSTFDSAATGIAPVTAAWTASSTVAANGSLFVRRSDRAVAGEVIVIAVRG